MWLKSKCFLVFQDEGRLKLDIFVHHKLEVKARLGGALEGHCFLGWLVSGLGCRRTPAPWISSCCFGRGPPPGQLPVI